MSYVIEIDDVTVWSPSLQVGEAFVGSAQALASAFSMDLGFTVISSDMVDIDGATFRAYVTALLSAASQSPAHHVLNGLIDAVLIPSLVMLERAGRPIDINGDERRTTLLALIRRRMPDG